VSVFERPVTSYASSPVYGVRPDDRLQHVQERLVELRVSCLAIVDESGRMVGVISRTDLIRLGRSTAADRLGGALLDLPDQSVEEVMTTDLITVEPDTTVAAAAAVMVERAVHRVFLCEDGQPVGVHSSRDLLHAIRDARTDRTVESIMSSPVEAVTPEMSVGRVTGRLAEVGIHGLVVAEDAWPIGVYGQREALAARAADADDPVEKWMTTAIVTLDGRLPAHRAAAQMAASQIRRLIVTRGDELVGIATSLDLARIAAERAGPPPD